MITKSMTRRMEMIRKSRSMRMMTSNRTSVCVVIFCNFVQLLITAFPICSGLPW